MSTLISYYIMTFGVAKVRYYYIHETGTDDSNLIHTQQVG